MPDVCIALKNECLTSLDGDYVIEVAPGTELTFSSIGFVDEKVVVPSVEEFTHNVVMQPENLKLDDVVVIAYGVRKKGTVAGSVSTVKSDKLESTPTAAFDQALQGQVAGLTVLSNTGEPSANNISGYWELVEWNGASMADGTYVYLNIFRNDRTYAMYHNIDSFGGVPHVVKSLTASTMVWVAKDDESFVQVFGRIDEIPVEPQEN